MRIFIIQDIWATLLMLLQCFCTFWSLSALGHHSLSLPGRMQPVLLLRKSYRFRTTWMCINDDYFSSFANISFMLMRQTSQKAISYLKWVANFSSHIRFFLPLLIMTPVSQPHDCIIQKQQTLKLAVELRFRVHHYRFFRDCMRKGNTNSFELSTISFFTLTFWNKCNILFYNRLFWSR